MRQTGTTTKIRTFVLVLLVLALALVLLILWRFLTPIILAVLLALLVAPVYARLREGLGGRRNLSALIVVAGVFLIVVVPVIAFFFLLVTQGVRILQELATSLEAGAAGSVLELPILERLQSVIDQALPEAGVQSVSLRGQLASYAESAVEFLVRNGVTVFGNVADAIAKFFILLFLLFYLVRDGRQMVERLRELLPLRDQQTTRIFEKIRDVTRAVVFGTLAVAVLQGALAGIGFRIVGLQGLIWGTVAGVASLIPVVGTGLVTLPAIVYLFVNGLYWQTAFFTLWAAVLVGGVDNYLRPFFMRGQAKMSPFYIFLAIIGGLATFGLSGLVFGPLVIALAIVVVEIYREEYRPGDGLAASGRARPARVRRSRSGPGSRAGRALRRSRSRVDR